MRNRILSVLVILMTTLFAGWEGISSTSPVSAKMELVNSNISTSTVGFTIDGFNLIDVATNKGDAFIAKVEGGASIMELGSPDLHQLATSVIIPDDKKMDIRVISSEFTEYKNIEIAPSKGNLSRDVNPSEIPYEWNDVYTRDEFFPGKLAELRDPYVLRDNRGQTIVSYPFQYNPMSKILRVYTSVVVEVYENGISDINVKHRQLQRSETAKVNHEYNEIYENHFLNSRNDTRFDYLVDQGNMLIVSYGDFMDEMEPFVEWKNQKGIRTEMVSSAEAGGNATAIKNYVTAYYYEHGLTFLLLVGDYSQIGAPSVSGSASDPSYGFIEGNDQYAEVIVGRFSANSPNEVITQVVRSLEYEKSPEANASWYSHALSIGSDQGPGYQGLDDDEFLETVIKPILLDYTYDNHTGIYDPSGTLNQGITAINNGVGVINYTGHGWQQGWGNGAPIEVSHVNNLTNAGKLPFIWTVGCNVGEFNTVTNSYAESWLRATHNGEPSGGVGHFGSTISQSWEPPMHGQVAFNQILTESYDNHKTRSFGGISFNGCMHMNDAQGSSGTNETKYWTLFGDPSIIVRTDAPEQMSANYNEVIVLAQQQFSVSQLSDGDLVAISRDGELLASEYAVGGQVNLALGDASLQPGQLDLVITGFNKFTHESTLTVISPDGAYVVMNNIETDLGTDNLITGGESISVFVTIENVGNVDASNISVSLLELLDDPFISITDGNANISSLDTDDMLEVELQFNVNSSVPNGYSFSLAVEVEFDGNVTSSTINLAVAPLVESFENNGFSSQSWSFSGDSDWSIDSGNSSNGTFSAKSGAIDNNMTSEISLSMDIVQAGYIKFEKKVSCENVGSSSGTYYDYLAFYIDGVEQGKWAGEVAWSQNSFAVSAGEHTFKWLYNKDQAVVSGEDAVWVDNIEFPPCVGSGGVLLGDPNYDGVINILDIVLVVNMILGISDPDLSSADVNQDGAVNVLDIVGIVNIILDSRGVDASEATLYNENGLISISSNGVIDAIQLKLRHDEDIEIQLTQYSLLSKMHTIGDETTVIIVAPESYDVLEADGEIEVIEVIVANSSGEVQLMEPKSFTIMDAYPNPFNPSTRLNYNIPLNGYLEINIYDLQGRMVESLYNDYSSAGVYTIDWNADIYSSGVYLAQFKYGNTIQTQKLMLVK
ncbi:MAG: T9SS type A sorting domain-containing protein [Candidatus Marinimicrobia bacterium]|nr:T9SS type A sorting domain-containing protein [Candidatus Neomarinimicrobiota bacterium]